MDSNVVERPVKSAALTRKNALLAGIASDGGTGAILASQINHNGNDPQTWLTYVIQKIVSGEVTINKRLDQLRSWTSRLGPRPTKELCDQRGM
mgnify:CR=1 FL=1